MKRFIFTLATALSTGFLMGQNRPSNTSVTVYMPNPTRSLQQPPFNPHNRYFDTGVYLGLGGVIDEPMNQRVVGSLMLVGDSYTASSLSASFNRMTDKMEYTMIVYIKLF